MADFNSERTDFKSEMADIKSERADIKSDRADVKPRRTDFRFVRQISGRPRAMWSAIPIALLCMIVH